MTFVIGRGHAKVQIPKKWTWPYFLNWVEYCDEILHSHWYWQDLAQGIVKCHLSLVEAFAEVQILKKKWNWPYLLNLLE